MKEILYIQAGNFANYVGTHFWNTQESYLSTEDPEDSIVDSQISFRNETEHSTLCPRLLIFDWKGNFGALSRKNALGDEENHEQGTQDLWTGNVEEVRQVPIPRSVYQSHMFENEMKDAGKEPPKAEDLLQGHIRYWSDYNRTYYVPRTIQQVAEPSEWQNPNGNWGVGHEVFGRYNEEHDLMDDSVRLFLEESDSLQGLQVTNDCDSFGGFTAAFLTSFRDDYRKTSCLVFPLLSGRGGGELSINDVNATRATISDALYLRTLNDVASITIPIQAPSQWSPSAWRNIPTHDKTNPYYSSAILSAHIESSTLPLRMTGGGEDLTSLTGKLNWEAPNPFGQISGTFPLPTVSDEILHNVANFTISDFAKRTPTSSCARVDVTRGFSAPDIRIFESYSSSLSSLPYPSRYHTLAYPLPSSFPPFLWRNEAVHRQSPFPHSGALPTVKGVSSLSGGDDLAALFEQYASFSEICVLKRAPAALSVGIDLDDLKELTNDLWTIHDNYAQHMDTE